MPSAFSRNIGVFDRLMDLKEPVTSSKTARNNRLADNNGLSSPNPAISTMDKNLILGDELLLRWDHIQENYQNQSWWW